MQEEKRGSRKEKRMMEEIKERGWAGHQKEKKEEKRKGKKKVGRDVGAPLKTHFLITH